jgi:hypothetical protein
MYDTEDTVFVTLTAKVLWTEELTELMQESNHWIAGVSATFE